MRAAPGDAAPGLQLLRDLEAKGVIPIIVSAAAPDTCHRINLLVHVSQGRHVAMLGALSQSTERRAHDHDV